jgi:uncharacterized membrane protein
LTEGEASAEGETSSPDAETTVSPLDDEGRLVSFQRDIAPILRAHCLECHGPEEAKNDFRVDDPESMMGYIEAEDVQASTMYVDYLTTGDEDLLMPPRSHGGPLSSSELALIRVWIEEGADWPEGFVFEPAAGEATASPTPQVAAAPQLLSERVWAAQGFLHPATVHFPIALFLLGGLFAVLGWKWPAVGTQIPLACLWFGSMTAIASTMMGWAFASEQGYGSTYNILEWSREVDVHRWSGLIVTVLSAVLSVVALVALWSRSAKLTRVWKVGLLLCAAAVGAVGHQGGEMSYGKDFYPKAWRILIGAEPQGAAVSEAAASLSAPPVVDPVPAEASS